ncbi:MAG: aminotransferase class I/II-fold pyridoxal phosphate-dependent enzyme [Planctomycetes bacterium]|nr:aminotransferase class I/II-fold pyridoxal phosphate-dependent enzyme [Planctomycetota bacterium]
MTWELIGNRNVIEMEYAVRGPVPQRAAELRKQGKKIISCNIGNPQALGQRPMTYCRQVMSLLEDPSRIARERELKKALAGRERQLGLLSDAVIETAERILAGLGSGVGAYSESHGAVFIREAVARFIDRRDGASGVRSDPERIYLTDGASEGARHVLEVLISKPSDGVMIPIPQYPLYSASIRKCGGTQVNYYPDEDAGWTLSRAALEESLEQAKRQGTDVKAIVVINPGNPTGAILPEESIRDVLDFAALHRIAVIADEVYQENVYGGVFVSFARVLGERDVPLFSLHSASKGFYGECGHRGGYLEVRNPPRVKGANTDLCAILYKQASVSLCPNVMGQTLTYLMVNPPQRGSEPYDLFVAEREGILADLHAKATMIRDAFREMQGVKCFGKVGAMYLFPRLSLPPGTSDFDYCMALLEKTGLCTVNGSGFGQKEGTQHLRIAFLPPKDLLAEVLPAWVAFHNDYVRRG